LEKGDKLRAFHQIKELSEDFDIHLYAITTKELNTTYLNELNSFCSSIEVYKLNKLKLIFNVLVQVFTRKPFQVGYFYQRAIAKKIQASIKKNQVEHIYCQLIRTAEYVKNLHEVPKTLDYMDALSKGMQRRIGREGFLKNIMIKWEYSKLKDYESIIFDYFDHHTIISEQDRKFIFHRNQKNIVLVQNGIDTVFFKKQERNKEFDIVFVGNLSYPPNVQACLTLVNDILPELKLQHPNVQILLAGASPSKDVSKLAKEGVKVSGWVDDIRDSYLSAKVFVAPLEIGTGLQNKLLEAMSLGIPSVTSKLVNNALGAEDRKDLILAESMSDYVKAIHLLLTDIELNKTISQNGSVFVQQNFDWKSATQPLNSILNK
jgi:glycosyltransferase involved in cell wall biosynthesis